MRQFIHLFCELANLGNCALYNYHIDQLFFVQRTKKANFAVLNFGMLAFSRVFTNITH